ncbi:8-oxoguanine DNA glycosylase OGG fold protein [Streptomyces mirabilis]|uniref:8-oxoguanine DNA glycosylase OGG fold protein n=1 Tax=Streptomyces mirabilis TaxID=68239 RepID=UPI003715A16F
MESHRTSGTAILPAGSIVPGRDDVLGQAIPFDRARWLSLLPDSGWWPGELDACPIVGGRPRVDRGTVFGISRRADTVEGRRHLLTACLVWGSGTKARSVARHSRIFTSSSVPDLDAHLSAALGVLRREGAVRAYFAFNNAERIKFLGPAFFTKVLYFAGHGHPVGAWRPLMLDGVVARSLRASDSEVKWPRGGWTTPQYSRYLSLAHDLAGETGVLPDQVEAALFALGRHLS